MESTWLNLPIQLQANKSMPTLTFLVQNSGPKVPPKLHCLAPSTFSPTGGKNELCGSAVNVFYPLCPKFQDSHFFLEVNVLPNASLCASGQAKPNNIPKPSGVWIRESFIAGPCKKNGWLMPPRNPEHLKRFWQNMLKGQVREGNPGVWDRSVEHNVEMMGVQVKSENFTH